MTSQSAGGDYFNLAWFWISDGNPSNPYPIYSTNNNLLVLIYQGDGENHNYNLVQVWRKTTAESGVGTALWEGRYSIDGTYPSLDVAIDIDDTNYSMTFNQTMTNTSGNLTGQHGMTFTDSLYANLGASNRDTGRGEGFCHRIHSRANRSKLVDPWMCCDGLRSVLQPTEVRETGVISVSAAIALVGREYANRGESLACSIFEYY